MSPEEKMIIRKVLEREQKFYIEADRVMASDKERYWYAVNVLMKLEKELGIDCP